MEGLNFNLFNILIIAGIIQGFVFSIVVLFNPKYKSQTNNYIVFTVLALSFSNFQYLVDDINLNGVFSIFKKLRIPCDLLIVPFFYLFINKYLGEKIKPKSRYFLYTPFILNLALNIILYEKIFINNTLYRTINTALETFSLLLSLMFIGMIYFKIKNYTKSKENPIKAETKWIIQILLIGTIMCVFWILTIIIMLTKLNTGLKIYYPLWLSISTLVYWISYVSLINSKINADRIAIRNSEISNKTAYQKNIKTNDNLYIKIENWIISNRIYLNPNLNLEMISEEFDISISYLSKLFNTNNNLNFNDYINTLRISEAKKMLVNKNYDHYTIVAIGLESGFNSKSSFYNAFKKFTNKTPMQFKKEVQNL